MRQTCGGLRQTSGGVRGPEITPRGLGRGWGQASGPIVGSIAVAVSCRPSHGETSLMLTLSLRMAAIRTNPTLVRK